MFPSRLSPSHPHTPAEKPPFLPAPPLTNVSCYEQRPFIFSELGHRKWTLVWRTVIIQTCSKCAFPHERQVQNGIKLVQGRFILVKESRIRDWSIGSNTFSHLIAQCWGPSAKFPLFFDPLFILPQWNRFPRIHKSLLRVVLSLVLFLSLSFFFTATLDTENEVVDKQRRCQIDKKNRRITSFQAPATDCNFSTSDLSQGSAARYAVIELL